MREHDDQRRLDEVVFKGILNVACTIETGKGVLYVKKLTAKHVIDFLVFLAVKGHCDGLMINLTDMFRSQNFQVEQLRGIKQGDDQRLVYLLPLPQLRLLVATVSELLGRLKGRQEHLRNELIQV